jgi:hypothetical protein
LLPNRYDVPQFMAEGTITFFCPACGVKLTVPASLGGVAGPCPRCQATIQAPQPGVPGIAPPPQGPSGPVHSPPLPVASAPAAAAPPPVAGAPPQPGSIIRPEPRQLPQRAVPAEVVARPMPESSHRESARSGTSSSHKRPRHESQRLVRMAVPALFVMASLALVYGVVTILKMPPEDGKPPRKEGSKPEESVAPAADFDGLTKPASPGISPPALPTPAADQTPLGEPTGQQTAPILSPAMDALEVLERFLSAKTLAERLPLIETKTPEEELATSILAAPFPTVLNTVIDAQETNPLESFIDFYYNVDFENGEARANPQTILVRTRRDSRPKVLVDPFLDMFGGRLAAYAATPSDKAATFQVLVYPVAACLDPKIREREKKRTLKLLARDNSREIALAHFSVHSKIDEMLRDGSFSLTYGSAKACTIMLDWNTEEQPEHPYLQAVKIVSLDWNH